MKRIWRIGIALLLALMPLISIVTPAYAISNPTSMAWTTAASTYRYKAFYDVYATGDALFIAMPYVHYVATPSEPASSAFLFEVLNSAGTTIYLSTPLKQYEARPISIYQTPTQVTALGLDLTGATAYLLRVRGNPNLFANGTGNTLLGTLSGFIDQDLGTQTDTLNPLRLWCLEVIKEMQTHDVPAANYWVTVQGTDYLTTTGGSLFLEGVSSLNTFVPTLFQSSIAPMQAGAPTSTGVYSATRTPAGTMNTTMANGLTNMGLYLHVPQWVAGVILIIGLTLGLSFYASRRLQSNLVTPIIAIAMLVLGTFFGLPPMTILFVFGLFVVGGLAVFFWGRINV